MANPEHLEMMKQGWTTWNKWREQHPTVIPDLSGIPLGGIKLRTFNLKDTDFRKSIFDKVDLQGGRLSNADFSGAKLKDVNLQISHLDGAKFVGAELISIDLKYADLRAANLSQSVVGFINFQSTKLDGAVFTDALAAYNTYKGTDLSKVLGLESVRHQNPSSIDIETLHISRGIIPDAFLRGCGVPEAFIVQIPALVASIEPIQFYSCFISYSSKDQDFAERLHADLQAKGVRVWFAPLDMAIGARIRPTIDESIRVYDKLLLVLSETSVHSQWVEQEVETALEKERESPGKTVLFPIRIDDAVMNSKAGWPALIKRSRNIGDFHNWKEHDSYTKAFKRLLRDLKATAG
jgi:hypothetical protein